jgi:uncharacterized protein
MAKPHPARKLNIKALAAEGETLSGTSPVKAMERLAAEVHEQADTLEVGWRAKAQLRSAADGSEDAWLHLSANAALPLTCQRCMAAVQVPVDIDQWYRFVATEEIAMAEDDESEEDLLVLEPQFDLLSLVEDELLMALPLVPMHVQCPTPVVLQVGADGVPDVPDEKPNPFAVLAKLKKKE